MKEFVEHLVKDLVDNPDQVKIDEIKGEETTIMEVRVAKADFGRVLGKHGRIIGAIRLLVAAVGRKEENRLYRLELLED